MYVVRTNFEMVHINYAVIYDIHYLDMYIRNLYLFCNILNGKENFLKIADILHIKNFAENEYTPIIITSSRNDVLGSWEIQIVMYYIQRLFGKNHTCVTIIFF